MIRLCRIRRNGCPQICADSQGGSQDEFGRQFQIFLVGAGKLLAMIAAIAFSGGGGIATINAFIAFGELKNEVRHHGDSLVTLDEKITKFGLSQTRMEGNMDVIVQFIMKGEKGGDSASLDQDESASNVPTGMSMLNSAAICG